MSQLVTIAVTHWVPVTELFTLKVDDEFNLDAKVDQGVVAGNEKEMYEILEKDGVKIAVPVTGEKQDFGYTQRSSQPLEAVTEEQVAKGEVPIREV